VAWRLKRLKFTPSGWTVAPAGIAIPATSRRAGRSPGPQSRTTLTGGTFQISSQYSRIARSDENFPARAVFRIDIRVQRSGSCHAALTRSWHATYAA